MEQKVKANEEKIPENIVQTFFVAFYRSAGSKWTPLSVAPEVTKESALRAIESIKKYDSFNNTEFRIISFDIETKI